MLNDPVTHEPLVDPFLASDGETYSRETLLAAMRADPWHRSPLTYEVLRPYAYRNLFVCEIMGQPYATPETLLLYDDEVVPPTDSREITWRAPALLGAEDTLTRRRFGLPDAAFSVTARVRRDVGHLDWLMHPPAPVEARDDVLALGRLLGADKAVQNPWCLSGAYISTGRTVEDQWAAHGGKPPRK